MAENEKILTNLFFAEKIRTITCKAIRISPPTFEIIEPEQYHKKYGLFIRELYKAISSVVGCYFYDRIYFIGDENQLTKNLNRLRVKFSNLDIGDVFDVTLTLNNDLPIIKRLLYAAIDSFLKSRGYFIRFRRRGPKIAVPQFQTITEGNEQISVSSIVNSRFGAKVSILESFRYRFRLFANGVNYFQLDPKVTVLAPASGISTTELANVYLIPMCFHEGQNYLTCPFLTRNVVKFIQYSPK